MFIQTDIKGINFNPPIINASGCWCTTEEELNDIGSSFSGAIVFKTMTLKSRQGNPNPRLYLSNNLSLNSMGLPNLGVDFYCQVAERLTKFGKPLIASIAGFSEEEFETLFGKVINKPFEAIEINLSCPNIEGKGLFAYDFQAVSRILKKIRKKSKKILGVKLPPFNQREEINKIVEILMEARIDFVTLINSVPLGCVIDTKIETLMIKPNQGVGGLGGEVIRPIALAQVWLFYQASKGKIPIIGVGGIKTGEDIYQFILAGAKVVAVGTQLLKEGPSVFARLQRELKIILRRKRVSSLTDKVGQARLPV